MSDKRGEYSPSEDYDLGYKRGFEDCQRGHTKEYALITAASEIGEDKSTYVEALNYAHAYERGSKEATAATIERCAQVIKSFEAYTRGTEVSMDAIAVMVAAIRALKDQP